MADGGSPLLDAIQGPCDSVSEKFSMPLLSVYSLTHWKRL